MRISALRASLARQWVDYKINREQGMGFSWKQPFSYLFVASRIIYWFVVVTVVVWLYTLALGWAS